MTRAGRCSATSTGSPAVRAGPRSSRTKAWWRWPVSCASTTRRCAGFVRPPAGWAAHAGAVGAGELICHGDFGPWNLVWRGSRPVGILDWDYAWPAPPIHDVAYALEYVAPFRDDHTCLRWLGYTAPPDRRRRMRLFAEAYGLSSTAGLVDEVIAQQRAVWQRARRLATQGRQPQVAWRESGVLDAAVERIRWSRANRHLFE
ncbi:phosphotransferase family protein [Dactylosporangium darangshiense]|uniref:phosphotransferase family protein n=1 Tax=Dactylosporangium darangshiense TaxID=579108 RepID=UPI003626A3D5